MNEHIADDFKDKEGVSIVSAAGGTAGVDEVLGRRYAASATSLLSASQFTMVADRMYTFFRPIPIPKTYVKISAVFGSDGASFSAGAQARLGAYTHLVGAPDALIAEVLITDAILTGNMDVLADVSLSIPAVAPGIFLTVMADRALKLSMMNEDGLSTLQLLDSKFTEASPPVVVKASVAFDEGALGQQPDNDSAHTVDQDSGVLSHLFIYKTTPGTPPAGTSHVQIGATVAITAANLKTALENADTFATDPLTVNLATGPGGANTKVEWTSQTNDSTVVETVTSTNAAEQNESFTPAVSAKLDPQFMLQRDLGAFGNLPDPHGAGTLQPVVNSVAGPGIMLEP